MSDISHAIPAAKGHAHGHSAGVFFRSIVIALTAFLSLVDLFATQAILPMLTEHYGVTPGQMGLASNASTLGMLVSGLAVGYFSSSIDRRRGILISLVLLVDPDGAARLRTKPHRVCDSAHPAGPVHGLGLHPHPRLSRRALQRAGFGLGLRRLHHRQCGEQSDRSADLGRRRRSFRARRQFLFLRAAQSRRRAARLFHRGEDPADAKRRAEGMGSHFSAWIMHLKNPSLRASFAIGFCILFAFIGTFTYVNFVLVRPPFSVDAMTLGIIYFVFLPAIATTPLAGRAVKRFGTRATFWGSLAVAALGLPLMLSPSLAAVLAGMVLVGVGTFFAQATATGFVGRAATSDRGSASGLYLAFYFFGGLMGAALLGQLFDRFGWGACVAGIGLSLLIAALLAILLKTPMTPEGMRHDA